MFRWLIRDWVWLVVLLSLVAMAVRHEMQLAELFDLVPEGMRR